MTPGASLRITVAGAGAIGTALARGWATAAIG